MASLRTDSSWRQRSRVREDGSEVNPGSRPAISLQNVVKVYKTAAGGYTALKSIDLEIRQGEFVGVIGKSGSGKSTLINMITGIDRPTSGEVWVGDAAVHKLTENQVARWRGRNLGIVFQFFQLLPSLSVVDNVMMPMDFCSTFPLRERRRRAMALLEMVEMDDHAAKLPSALSGGQQQRVAIARALANDPPILIADEPTGNLDSKMADAMFGLFETLVAQGKTVVMVTHDGGLARRVSRTVIIADGEVVNEYVARAMPTLTPQQMLTVTHGLQPASYQPGATIIDAEAAGDRFYILAQGNAEVVLKRPGAPDVLAERLQPGQFFGEVSLFTHSRTLAAVRAAPESPVDVLALDGATFQALLAESQDFRGAMQAIVDRRIAQTGAALAGQVTA